MIPPPIHLASTLHGAVHKSVTVSYELILVQLNKCVVVCGSVLYRDNMVMVVSASIWFKCECRMGHYLVLS